MCVCVCVCARVCVNACVKEKLKSDGGASYDCSFVVEERLCCLNVLLLSSHNVFYKL